MKNKLEAGDLIKFKSNSLAVRKYGVIPNHFYTIDKIRYEDYDRLGLVVITLKEVKLENPLYLLNPYQSKNSSIIIVNYIQEEMEI